MMWREGLYCTEVGMPGSEEGAKWLLGPLHVAARCGTPLVMGRHEVGHGTRASA